VVKSSHTFIYGAEPANKFSADQGYSEHQLGTTVDFTTQKAGAANFEFNATGAYSWLKKNAHIYGFTLSYPAGNAYYAFEPWHWRFVGTALATKLFSDGTFFYDLPQREIDEYLINLFD
jgi:zinc D-Ala-D-Ala carboxypeptidase